jgi:protein involved in polysaccharide export with SLBB domain
MTLNQAISNGFSGGRTILALRFLTTLSIWIAAFMTCAGASAQIPPSSAQSYEMRTSQVQNDAVRPTATNSLSAAPLNADAANISYSAQPAQSTAPQQYDYALNIKSDVFGANLFTGAFAAQGAAQFNPDYVLAVGDKIHVRFWGAFQHDSVMTVDPKGNIFLPHIGPVKVAGIRNQDLQKSMDAAAGKVFRTNVFSYASLAQAQPVRIFVSGFVNRPGLYGGTSMDSLLSYIDQAGGIDPERGSFINIQIKRGNLTRATLNLYDFLLEGRIPLVQLSEGDVILVGSRQSTLRVSGLVENAKRFEFNDSTKSVADLMKLARPRAQATHVRVVRNSRSVKNTEYYPLSEASGIPLQNGDELDFTSDKLQGTISVRVEGEHQSSQEYVLPYGSKIGDLIKKIEFSERSDSRSLQLFRQSVKLRQKAMLETSLNSLQSAALTARSGTSDEARLRKEEAELLLQWVDRARKIEPSGQVLIAQQTKLDSFLLENGDLLRVPVKDDLILISGEVLFPNAVAFDAHLNLDEYIRRSGGYTQNADVSRVIVAHRDGSFDEVLAADRGYGSNALLRSGDEVLVLPKIDVKSRQIWKDLTQIIYQIAVSAKVVLGL